MAPHAHPQNGVLSHSTPGGGRGADPDMLPHACTWVVHISTTPRMGANGGVMVSRILHLAFRGAWAGMLPLISRSAPA